MTKHTDQEYLRLLDKAKQELGKTWFDTYTFLAFFVLFVIFVFAHSVVPYGEYILFALGLVVFGEFAQSCVCLHKSNKALNEAYRLWRERQ